MSPLFSFFLCSHYMSFPLSIFNLLFFPTLPFLSFLLFSPICHFPLCLTPFPSDSTSRFYLHVLFHILFSSITISPIIWPLCHPSLLLFFLPLVPPSLHPLLPLLCRVWEVTTGEVLNTLIHHNEAVLHLRFANGLMVTCSKDRSIAVWDMASPTDISLRRVLVGHRAAVNVVDFDDKYIVSASGDRTIKVTRATVHELRDQPD